MKKLKTSEIKATREAMLKDQGGLCGVCGTTIQAGQDRLDHSHVTGLVRAVLCNPCNAVEGVLLLGARRYAVKDLKKFLVGLSEYYTHHETDRTGLIHPTHKTPEEKKAKASAKAKAKRQATKVKK